jgi:hypothetical protein
MRRSLFRPQQSFENARDTFDMLFGVVKVIALQTNLGVRLCHRRIKYHQ